MNVEEYCLSLPGAVEDYPFGDGVAVFKIAGKTFALTNPAGKPTSINLKCDPVLAVTLRHTYPAVTPGYHMNKTHWNTVQLDGSVPEKELMRWIEMSFNLVAPKPRTS